MGEARISDMGEARSSDMGEAWSSDMANNDVEASRTPHDRVVDDEPLVLGLAAR